MRILSTFNPIAFVRSRFSDWLQTRLPSTDTLLLTQGNLYILPTRAGLMFCATLVVLLVASINYQLNLGYVLTFLLAGSGLMSMHLTHANLRGLTLHLKPVANVFASEPAVLDVVLTSPNKARYGVGLKVSGTDENMLTWIDVPALGQAHAQVSFVPVVRGLHDAPTLTLETRFPLGLFRTWTVWRPAARLLVYPTPERPAAKLPPPRATPSAPTHAPSADGNELDGVRTYRRGDPLKIVAWKKAARTLEAGGELVSRDSGGGARHELWLDWQACSNLSPEDRLARLTAWTLVAHDAAFAYGLRLPALELKPSAGAAHRNQCLEALALWH